MKTIRPTLITSLFLFSSLSLFSQIKANSYWEKFDTTNGLISNNINEVLIENDSNVWITSDSGLTHFDGVNFTNYNSSYPNFPSGGLSDLVLSQNKLFMIAGQQLASFDGLSFTVYDTSNGLGSASRVWDITTTKDDTLWLCQASDGASKFDGAVFTSYPNMVGLSIEADSLDRVYLALRTGLFPIGLVALYENGAWSNPNPSGDVLLGSGGYRHLKLTKDGELYGVSGHNSDNKIVKISYPLNYQEQNFYLDGTNGFIAQNSRQNVNTTLLEKVNGEYWFATSPNGTALVGSTHDSLIKVYSANELVSTTTYDINEELIIVGTTNGLFISKIGIQPTSPGGEELSVNELETSIRITDPIFSDIFSGLPNLEFPKNSGNHGVWSSNFIVAAKKIASSSYNVYPQNGFQTAFAPGPISRTAGLTDQFLLKISQQEITLHQSSFNLPNYTMPKAIENWPAYGDSTLGVAKDLAPFFDANNNGCYDPTNGDYPIIKGDEAIYWINHPLDKSLELEYHWMMYGYSSVDTALSQTLFLDYTIVNRANTAFDTIKLGYYFDSDLGSATDDYVGCDSINNIMYSYNGGFGYGQYGSPGYGNRTPALGVKFISDPMDTYLYYFSNTGPNGNPDTGKDWINYMNAKWKNGQPLLYGGDGFSSLGTTTNPTTHMFTGDPYNLTGWTELTPGVGQQMNSLGDRRMFGSIPSFSLQPNERKTIEIAVSFGRTVDTSLRVGKNIAELIRVLNSASSYNDSIVLPLATLASNDTCSVVTSLVESSLMQVENLHVYPVPTSTIINIQSTHVIYSVQLYDIRGTLIKRINSKEKELGINIEGLAEGIYFLNALTAKGVKNAKFIVTR